MKRKRPHDPVPPRFCEWILKRTFPDNKVYSTIGDLEECFQDLAEERGRRKARTWYRLQCLKSLLYYLKNLNVWSFTMLKNYLKLTFRLINRDKFHYFLNILGLSTGIACGIIIMLYLQNELTYDRFHEKADRIYRVGTNVITSGEPIRFAIVSPALGNYLKNEYPEIEDFVRIRPMGQVLLQRNEKIFYESELAFADANLFHIFSYNFIYGSAKTSLNDPFSLVLSETLARKYFGEGNPIGEVIRVENNFSLKVTGVIEDPPKNAHMPLKGFCSYSSYDPDNTGLTWPILEVDGYTYLLLSKHFTFEQFYAKWPEFYDKYIAETAKLYGQVFEPIFQKLPDIHYGPQIRADFPIGNRAYLGAFFAVGLFVLLLAGINYTNLATAQAANRAREIGVKKVLGSGRKTLVFQLLGESYILSFLATLAAVILTYIFMAFTPFSQALNITFKLNLLNNPTLLLGIFGLFVFIGLFSGIYPAIYLSSGRPTHTLIGRFSSGRKGSAIRRALVTFQFVISIGVVIMTFFMNDQIQFMRRQSLGFKKENVISLIIRDQDSRQKIPALLEEIRRRPEVISAASGRSVPGSVGTGLYWFEGKEGTEEHNYHVFVTGYDYLKTLGIELTQGRDFSREYPTDTAGAVLVNQKLAQELGWESPLGKKISQGNNFQATVIGVVKNFNYFSLHNEIEPLIIRLFNNIGSRVIVRFHGDKLESVLSMLESKWREICPNRPFMYSFLDEDFDRLYENDQRQNRLYKIFSSICIIISCLGLFGLSSFTAVKKTKEIAIRKVHGATSLRIIRLLSKNIFFLIVTAAVIAVPISLYFILSWRNNFAYRTGINPLIFILTAAGALAVAFLTSSYHSIRVARANPVDSLRYE